MAKKKIGTGRKVILAVCILIFIISASFVVKHFVEIHNNQQGIEELSGLVSENTEPVTDDSAPDYSELIKKNPDFVGWITVPNTQINHPIVKGSNNEFYLNHNFDKAYDTRGSVFMDYRNDALDLDANTIIYAHNSYDKTMFSELTQYDNIDFYKQSPIFYFNTTEKKYTCKIYAVYITSASASEDNGYVFNYIYPYMVGDNFDGYIEEVNKRRLYVTDVDINKDDEMVTLSTCARNLDLFKYGRRTYRANVRIVILGRTLRPGETPEVDVNKAYLNENPKYPQLYYDKHGIANPYKNDEKWYPKEVAKS